MVGVPVQVPVEAATVAPSAGAPLIAGSTVLAGSVGRTIADAVEPAWADPAALVAVTTTRVVPPTSADVSR